MAGAIGINDYLDIGDHKLDGWNWRENFVQKDTNEQGANNFVYGETTLIVAGPAQIGDGLDVTKVGLTPSINLTQQIPQQRIYEVGSRRCHILQGIPVGGMSINRMLYNGPSLLRAFYGSLYDDSGVLSAVGETSILGSNPSEANKSQLSSWKQLFDLSANDRVLAGNADTLQWISLWDPRLYLSFGIGMMFNDIMGGAAGGVYAEGAKVSQQGFGVQAGQMSVIEGLNISFDRLIPISRGTGAPSA